MSNLIVEDGTGIVNANTYVDIDYVKSYLTSRVANLPSDAELERHIVLACDFIESINRFSGTPTNAMQPLQFPRSHVYVAGATVDPATVPEPVKRAQAQLVLDTVLSGKPLMSASTAYALKRRTLGPLTMEYATGSGKVNTPVTEPHPRFWSLISPYLNGGTSGGGVIR